MNAFVIYSSATGLGIAWGVASGTLVYARLVRRLRRRETSEAIASDLEKRRDIHLSGRTDEVRKHAGPPANLDNLFPVKRLGTLARNKIDKTIDTQGKQR